MSQVENVFNGLTDEEIKAYSTENITEEYILIDSNRVITVPESLRRIAVQHDHNIETVTFRCVRYWDGHDMSEMTVYINYMLPDNSLGSYLVESKDIRIDESDPEFMYFDWTISSEITKLNGNLAILVTIRECEAADPDNPDDVVISKQWNTELNTSMQISKGLEGPVAVLQQYPDIIEQLLIRMGRIENPGLSPVVDVAEISNGYRIIVRDIEGDKTFYVSHGTSPKVDVEETKDGHRVTVTDNNGEKSFEVIDGERGSVGAVFQNIDPDTEGGTTYTVDIDRKYRIYPDYMIGSKIGELTELSLDYPDRMAVAIGPHIYSWDYYNFTMSMYNPESPSYKKIISTFDSYLNKLYAMTPMGSKIYMFGEWKNPNANLDPEYRVILFDTENKGIAGTVVIDGFTSEGVSTAVTVYNGFEDHTIYVTKQKNIIAISGLASYLTPDSPSVVSEVTLPNPAYSATVVGDKICYWCEKEYAPTGGDLFVFDSKTGEYYSYTYTDRTKVRLASANGMVYMLGSRDSNHKRTSLISRLDPITGEVVDLGYLYDNDIVGDGNAMTNVSEIGVVTVDDKIYICGLSLLEYDTRPTIEIGLKCLSGTYPITFRDPRDNYKEYFDFEVLNTRLNATDNVHKAVCTYEVDGEIKTAAIEDENGLMLLEEELVISDAVKVLSHNMEASDSDEDDSDIIGKLAEHEEKIEDLSKRVANLEDVLVEEKVVESMEYVTPVPANVGRHALLDAVGGMTYKCKNLANIYGFSANDLRTLDDDRSLRNNYGTSISTIDTSNSITVIQADFKEEYASYHYENGYFNIGIRHDFKEGDEFTFSCEVMVTDNPSGVNYMQIMLDSYKTIQVDISSGRIFVRDTWGASNTRKCIEIRLCGISAVFSNFMLERGHTDGKYEPYYRGLYNAKVTAIESRGKNLYNKDSNEIYHRIASGGLVQENISWKSIYIDVRGLDSVTITNNNLIETSANVFVTSSKEIGILSREGNMSIYPGNVKTIQLNSSDYEANYVCISVWGDKFDTVAPYIQVEAGDTATEYTPYREPITYTLPESITSREEYGLGVIDENGTATNAIDFENKKFYPGRVRKITFYGYENYWTLQSINDAGLANFNYSFDVAITHAGVCNHFSRSEDMISNATSEGVFYSVSNGSLYFRVFDCQTLDEWKEKLANWADNGDPLIVVCGFDDNTSIDIDADDVIEVEPGGSIVACNERAYGAYTKTAYIVAKGGNAE